MLRDLKLSLLLRLGLARWWLATRLLGLRFGEVIALPLAGEVLLRTHRYHPGVYLTHAEAERLALKLLAIVDGPGGPAGAPVPAPVEPPDGRLTTHNRLSAYFAAQTVHAN